MERTFSECKAGLLSQTVVDDYAGLLDDLKAGPIKAALDCDGNSVYDAGLDTESPTSNQACGTVR